MFQAANGHEDCADLLLNNGADVTARDLRGRTPLHMASACGNVGLLGALLQITPSAQLLDNKDYTPLHIASYNGRYTPLHIASYNGQWYTPLHIASYNGQWYTPLHIASYNGQWYTEKLLFYQQNNVHIVPSNGHQYRNKN